MPRDRAAGADARDEVRHATVGLRPHLGPGREVVRARVLRVRVLVGLPRVRQLAHEPVAHRVVRVRVRRVDGGRAHHDLGAVRAHHVDLVGRDLVRADEHAAVAALLRDDREADARVARRRLDDRAARLQRARLLGGVDHAHGDPVLHRAARVQVLDLREHRRRDARGDVVRAAPAACRRRGRVPTRWTSTSANVPRG